MDSGTRFLLSSIAQHAEERNVNLCAPQSTCRPSAVLQIAVDNVEYCSGGYISSCDRQAVRFAVSDTVSILPGLTAVLDVLDRPVR